MALTAEQRTEIRAARDAAVRQGWDAHAHRAGKLEPDVLLQVLDHEEWLTTREIGERLDVRRQEAKQLARALMALPQVEWRGGRGNEPRRFRRKIPPAG